MKKIVSIALSGLMALSMAGCGGESSTGSSSTTAASGTESTDNATVVVAVMCPLSGEYSRFGEQYKAAIEAAMKYVNENDMLNDYQLQFEYIDDKGTTDGAPTAANLALDQYECNVAVGHMLTTMVLADGQYFEDAETPLLGIVSGPASVAQGWEYISIETGTDITQADTLVDYLVSNGSKNISLINVNTEGGMSAADEIENVLRDEYQLELATHEQIDNNVTDFTSIALKMKDAGTDTVIYWGLSQANGQI
ncbi:MAG: ABC transporter substrate-binding protein, partial [Ruminococcus sp.]|nr:ABC transporter substrate-binding protein [Ruminococcus sp.]